MDAQFFIGLFGGFIISFALLLVAQKMNDTSARYDELCSAISGAADISSAYWLMDANAHDVRLDEAKILGLQTKINLMFILLEKEDWAIKKLGNEELDSFLDTITGGTFQVADRNPDPERCIEAQTSAATLIAFLRKNRKRKFWIV